MPNKFVFVFNFIIQSMEKNYCKSSKDSKDLSFIVYVNNSTSFGLLEKLIL